MATIFIFLITNTGFCQSEKSKPSFRTKAPSDTTLADTTYTVRDSIKLKNGIIVADSSIAADSLTKTDSLKRSGLEERLGIKISKDALPSIVKAAARDSAVLDMDKDIFHLYGKAQVNYEDMQLNAGQVNYSQVSNVVTAAPLDLKKDTGTERPSFKQGSEKFTYDSMQYNFKSKRAIVRNVNSQYGEGFVHSEQVKRNPDQSIYGANSVYTTCALDT
ncbi:MAG: hypothetical protein K9G49_15765, partial [Taibaiella sp.]|nr:hypothetical protein [Taibaiella sp.]